MLTAAIGADGLIGSAFSGSVAHASWPGRAMLLTTAAWGAAITGFGFSRALLPAMACLAAAGAADITTVLFRGTLVRRTDCAARSPLRTTPPGSPCQTSATWRPA